MTRKLSPRKTALTARLLLIALAMLPASPSAQTAHRKTDTQQELVRIETGFFEAWKSKDAAYFRSHIPENGVFWTESGTLSREEQLSQQQSKAKTCTVEGYGLSDFRALPLPGGSYLLTYKAEQYATCDGEKLPVHLNGSSVYIFKDGRWQAIYRAQVPLKNQS